MTKEERITQAAEHGTQVKERNIPVGEQSTFSEQQSSDIARYGQALKEQLAAKPQRYEHSLSVARTAERLAAQFGANTYEARVAGILHDWCKAYSSSEQIELAERYGLSFDVSLDLLTPVIHGPLAARMLPEIFPELTENILRAISCHTVAEYNASDLDKIVYVADLIEPLRPQTPAITALQSSVETATLDELFVGAMSVSLAFVIETKRYLWPHALEIYNDYVLRSSRV